MKDCGNGGKVWNKVMVDGWQNVNRLSWNLGENFELWLEFEWIWMALRQKFQVHYVRKCDEARRKQKYVNSEGLDD